MIFKILLGYKLYTIKKEREFFCHCFFFSQTPHFVWCSHLFFPKSLLIESFSLLLSFVFAGLSHSSWSVCALVFVSFFSRFRSLARSLSRFYFILVVYTEFHMEQKLLLIYHHFWMVFFELCISLGFSCMYLLNKCDLIIEIMK